jgi:hypothetical protein
MNEPNESARDQAVLSDQQDDAADGGQLFTPEERNEFERRWTEIQT